MNLGAIKDWWRRQGVFVAALVIAGGAFSLGLIVGDLAGNADEDTHLAQLAASHKEAIDAKDELIARLSAATANASTAAVAATEQAVQATDEAKAASAKSAQAAQTAQVAAAHAKAATADARAVKSTVSDAMRAATKTERKP